MPHRREHGLGRREQRQAQAGHDHRRAYLGQHRYRPGLCCRRPWLQADADHASLHEPGAAQGVEGIGRRTGADRAGKRHEGAIEKANEIVASDPAQYFLPGQFENPANPAIHEKTTGPEIWNDTDGAVDVLVAGVGTGGTITGVSRYIKHTQGKAILSVAVEPVSSPLITQTLAGEELKPSPHKIQGIGAGFVPKNLDLSIVDQVVTVTDEESKAMAIRLMQEEGILCGISCGAAMAAAVRLAEKPEMQGKTIVVILPDSGERYLSSMLFSDMFSEQENQQ